MSLYGDKKDFQEKVKLNIEKAKILNTVSPENYEKALNLIEKKEKIIEKNGLFASFQLNIINHKLKKIQNI